jgi:hypothetical protein
MIAMNLFPGRIENLFRGDHSLLEEPFQDPEGAALQVLIGLFVELAMFTDEIDE